MSLLPRRVQFSLFFFFFPCLSPGRSVPRSDGGEEGRATHAASTVSRHLPADVSSMEGMRRKQQVRWSRGNRLSGETSNGDVRAALVQYVDNPYSTGALIYSVWGGGGRGEGDGGKGGGIRVSK